MQGLHEPVLWGRPRGCLSRAAPGPHRQRHVHYVSCAQGPPAAAPIPAATAWAAPYQWRAKAPSLSCHAAPGKAAPSSSSSSSSSSSNSRGAKSMAGTNRNTQQPRRQEQQQEAPQKRPRRQHSSTAASAPSIQVSPKQLTVDIKQQTSMAGLQGLLQRNSSVVNAIHVNAALQWLVANPAEQPQSPEQMAALVQQWMGRVNVDDITARLCANLAYYCSKLGYVEDLGLYRALLQRFMVVKEDADPQGVSNLLLAFGSREQLRGLLTQDVLVSVLQQLQQVAGRATPQNLANGLWAAAKVEPGSSPQLGLVVKQLLGSFMVQQDGVVPQNLSNILYALALLPRAWPIDSALQLVERLVQLLPQAQPQHMSNVLWALGQYAEQGWLSGVPKQVFARMVTAATQLLKGLTMQDGALKVNESGRRSRLQPTPQNLANACWGMAKLQPLWDAPPGEQAWKEAFTSAVQGFVPLLPEAIPQNVANMMWACAVVHHHPQQLLQALTSAPMPQVQQAEPQHASNLAWALAIVAPDPPPAALMASLLQREQDLLAQQPSVITSQDLANIAWAVAVLDQQQLAQQLLPLATAAFSQQQWANSQAESLYQWHQVHLWLTDTQVLGPAGLGAFPGVSQQQLEQCRGAWERQVAAASAAQKEVAKALSSMPSVEVVGTEQRDQHDGSRSIDIVARYKGQLLAVEVDGPTHFTWPGQRLTGETLARNRALERRDYRVVSVPLNPGWDQQRGQQQRQQFLQRLLNGQPTTATSSPPSKAATQSSRSPLKPTLNSSLRTAPIAAGASGLLARPQRPRPAAAPGQPAKKKTKSS